jgi:hypothetical protein
MQGARGKGHGARKWSVVSGQSINPSVLQSFSPSVLQSFSPSISAINIAHYLRIMVVKKIGITFFFVMLVAIQLFALKADSVSGTDDRTLQTEDSLPLPEWQNPQESYLFGIPVDNSAQIITEVHRLAFMAILHNKITPCNFDFRRIDDDSLFELYNSPVPIFIRGHALLN